MNCSLTLGIGWASVARSAGELDSLFACKRSKRSLSAFVIRSCEAQPTCQTNEKQTWLESSATVMVPAIDTGLLQELSDHATCSAQRNLERRAISVLNCQPMRHIEMQSIRFLGPLDLRIRANHSDILDFVRVGFA